jgi:fluoride exporter
MLPGWAGQVLLVALGGALGAALRFVIVHLCHVPTPWPIMAVNMLGCMAYGWFSPMVGLPPAWRLTLLTGILGGFTTFSSYVHEAHQSPGSAWLWLVLSPVLGYASYLLGQWMQKQLF